MFLKIAHTKGDAGISLSKSRGKVRDSCYSCYLLMQTALVFSPGLNMKLVFDKSNIKGKGGGIDGTRGHLPHYLLRKC